MNKKVPTLTIVSLLSLGAIAYSTSAVFTASANESPYSTTSIERNIPDKLTVPEENELLLRTAAQGVQIYICQPSENNSNQFEWTLKAPEADLLSNGDHVGTHYQGPTWEFNDGSKVVGEVQVPTDSPDSNAIPWLLLKAKTNEGDGVFSRVTYIQRVNTSGGKAPTSDCDRSTVNSETRVNYTADYYYYAAR